MQFLEKLKEKLGIESTKQFYLVLLTFSLTGTTIAFGLKPIIYSLLGVTAVTPTWEKIMWWLIFIFPSYYLFLFIYGTLLGQKEFFVNWIKRKGRKAKEN